MRTQSFGFVFIAANPCSSATCLPGESCANIYGINGGYNCVPGTFNWCLIKIDVNL